MIKQAPINNINQKLKQMFDNLQLGWSYCENGTIEGAVIFNIFLGTFVYVLSKLTNEYSWVDRIWSFLPIGYAVHFILHPLKCGVTTEISNRSLVMTGLIVLWGLRLSYNYWRKGGYQKGGQDYRWPYLRKKWGGVKMELLLFFFVAYYQIFLIMWFTLPVYYVNAQSSLTLFDHSLFFAALAALLLQKTSDDQQWEFQTQKHKYLKNNKGSEVPQIYKNGFITSGLWRFSRHPNFLGQLSFWWIMGLFSAHDVGLNLSILGVVQLTLLFQGSTRLTEQISVQKYPLYKIYQKNVPMILPSMFTSENVLEKKKN